MKTKLFFLKKKLLLFLFLFFSIVGFSQTTLVEYNFNSNTLAGSNINGSLLTSPTLKYFNSSGVEIAPIYSGGTLKAVNNNDYLEISIDTRGFSNISVSLDGFFSATGVVGSGTWYLTMNPNSDTLPNTYTNVNDVSMTSFFGSTGENSLSAFLNNTADNKQYLKLRIRASDFLFIAWNASLRLDNIKITAGNPKIKLYTDGNVHIPHLSAASTLFTTDFGTRQTTDAGLSRTFRVRNFQGTAGTQLNISNITVTGLNPGDFTVTPISLSEIEVSSSDTGIPFKTFTISFLPLADGIRTAEINVYSNSAPSPYIFTVVGTGASCTLVSGTYAQNTMATGSQTLVANYVVGDLIGGVANPGASNTLGTRLYPSGNLYTSSSTSWYVRGTAEKEVIFGGLTGLNIANQKNVSINFNVGAFTTNDTGVSNAATIDLYVWNPTVSQWSKEMHLKGADTYWLFGTQTNYYQYNFIGGAEFLSTYDGDNSASESINTSSVKYKNFKLVIPVSSNIQNLIFKIVAKTDGNTKLWLLDDVRVLTDNAVLRTFTTGNVWSPSPPTANEKALIQGSYTVPNTNLSICECEVSTTGSVTIPANRTLTVRNKITNNGNGDNFTIQTGGNLIQTLETSTNSGMITAERAVTDMDNVLATQMDYVYWSTPVTGQNLQAFSPGTPASQILKYNEYDDYFSLATGNFVAGKGYAFSAEVNATYPENPTGYNKTYKFKGVPNNGIIDIAAARSPNTGAVVHGYNLIGNPYPSNLSFPQFYALNSTKIYNTAWFWTNNFYTPNQQGSGYSGNNYAIFNGTGGVSATGSASSNPSNTNNNTNVPNGIIPVGQGFIVQVRNVGNTTLQFRNMNGANAMRVSTTGSFFNKNQNETNRFWLKLVSPSDIANTVLIGYIPDATDEFEQDYDAETMGMSSDLMYSILEDKKLLIQGKSAFKKEDKISLGANFFNNGTYTISLMLSEGIFIGNQDIYLKDNQLNIYTNLKQGSYTFDATKGIDENRFEIVYQSESTLTTQNLTKSNVQIYRENNDFILKSSAKTINEVEVYEMSGKLVQRQLPKSKNAIISSSSLLDGIYIVKLILENGEVVTKKIRK